MRSREVPLAARMLAASDTVQVTHGYGRDARSTKTPTQRMTQVLWMLSKAPNQTLRSSEIWDAIVEYDEGRPSGRRLYRMDIASLNARGLIRSGEHTATIQNREAIKLRFIGRLRPSCSHS